MTRPGVEVTLRETPSAVSLSVDTGTWFVTGLADRGPTTPTLISSLAEFESVYGPFVAYSTLYDALDVFFREGGQSVYVSRVVGPAATTGTLNLSDASAGISLVANALGPGAYSAGIKVSVVAGVAPGSFVIKVHDAANTVLEDSGDLDNQNVAVAWSKYSEYIRLVLGASALDPAVIAPTVLSTGNDDRAAITDAQWQAALDGFDTNLGPGQVSSPGRTTSVAHSQLTGHAESHDRVAILDYPNSPTVATLQAAAAAIPDSRFAAGFAPWLVVPGTVVGTNRTVPPSALVAGLIARNDPGVGAAGASAGSGGLSRFGIDLSQPDWTGPQRQTLNESGVNVIRRYLGAIQVYGWRSLANPNTDITWLSFGNGRYIMSLTARLNAVGEGFVFATIDGQNGRTIDAFHTALSGEVMADFTAGQLFGDTAAEAFNVNTGPQVNTLESLERLELRAVVTVAVAPIGELVAIEIVKRRITEPL